MLNRHGRSIGLQSLDDTDEYDLRRLVKAADGNPQLMKLALGLVEGARGIDPVIDLLEKSELDKKFKTILDISWGQLNQAARDILLATPLFAGIGAIREDGLAAVSSSTREPAAFAEALAQCERRSLLEQESLPVGAVNNIGRRYLVPSMVKLLAQHNLDQDKQRAAGYDRRFSEYFLSFVRERVVRPQPNVPYWNALISKRSLEVDLEWKSVQRAMQYAEEAGQEENLIQFVLLLTHYMDCRFYTSDRLNYVQKAIDILKSLNRAHDAALLSIDALGWTYLEEDSLDLAEQAIKSGLEMVERSTGPGRDDLRALGLAWLARLWLERLPDAAKAFEVIEAARDIKCSPWIKSRVLMIAGDIQLRRGQRDEALELYRHSCNETTKYDGAAEYQLFARMGLAYLSFEKTEEARAVFYQLLDTSSAYCIETGKLYAQYGLARVARMSDEPNSAYMYVANIKSEIRKRERPNHLLLKLIDELCEERRVSVDRRQN